MTRKQFAVVASRIKQEIDNIEGLHKELSAKGLTGSKKRIKTALPEGDTFVLRATGSILHDFYALLLDKQSNTSEISNKFL